MSDEVIACPPVKEFMGIPYTPPDEGYEKIKCERCGEESWIGPRQRNKKAERPDTPVICVPCVVRAGVGGVVRSLGGK